jgi:DNA-binding MarR family transcriptional regulator
MTQPASQSKKGRPTPAQFKIPGYSGPMAALLDIIRYGPDLLGLPRTAVLLFIAERTIPYRKLADAASLTQMVSGVYGKDGDSIHWIRLGCGLKQSTVKEAVVSLVAMGFLEKQKRSDTKRGNLPTQYAIRWEALRSYFVDKSATKICPLGRHTAKESSEPVQIGHSNTPLAATRLSPWPSPGQEQYLDSNSAWKPGLNTASPGVHHHHQKKILANALASLALGKTSLNRTEAKTTANARARANPLSCQRRLKIPHFAGRKFPSPREVVVI